MTATVNFGSGSVDLSFASFVDLLNQATLDTVKAEVLSALQSGKLGSERDF